MKCPLLCFLFSYLAAIIQVLLLSYSSGSLKFYNLRSLLSITMLLLLLESLHCQIQHGFVKERCNTVPAPGALQAFEPHNPHVCWWLLLAWTCSTGCSILLSISLSGEYASFTTQSYWIVTHHNKWNRCGSWEWGLEVVVRLWRMSNGFLLCL